MHDPPCDLAGWLRPVSTDRWCSEGRVNTELRRLNKPVPLLRQRDDMRARM